jgi:hypothetical protein
MASWVVVFQGLKDLSSPPLLEEREKREKTKLPLILHPKSHSAESD